MSHQVETTGTPRDQALEPHLAAFIQGKVNTFVKWDLARFFDANPHLADTSAAIAQCVGRDADEVSAALAELVTAGVFVRLTIAEPDSANLQAVFRLTPEADMRTQLHDFVQACDDPAFRINAIRQVMNTPGA